MKYGMEGFYLKSLSMKYHDYNTTLDRFKAPIFFFFRFREVFNIVFDEYLEPSPKDHEHRFRQKNSCTDLVVRPEKKIPASRENFLTNWQNKEQLMEMLMETLTKVGEQILKSSKHADTLVVQKAVTQTYGGNKSVQVLANDSGL